MAKTYRPIKLNFREGTETILVSRDSKDILETISACGKSDINESVIQEWIDSGRAFWLNPQGTRAMHLTEIRTRKPHYKSFTKLDHSSADIFLNIAKENSEPILLKASKSYLVNDLENGIVDIEALTSSGDAFTNMTEFLKDRLIEGKADKKILQLRSNYNISSPEWSTWTNATSQYNGTSLTEVFGEYFRERSTADNGGMFSNQQDLDLVDYVPKRGYPGTLAPGEKFLQDCAVEDLPRALNHPWPAMQEIQWHVRWPPSHPMIPPPLLWFAMNDMYTENFTNWQLNTPSDEMTGGYMMTPVDALKIARTAKLGLSYKPEEQIPHGGLIFPGAFIMKNYNPDHGPTVADEVAKAPIPKHLLPITERWLDPYFGITVDVKDPTEDLSDEDQKQMLLEEEERRIAAEALMGMFAAQATESSGFRDVAVHDGTDEHEQTGVSSQETFFQEEFLKALKATPFIPFAPADPPPVIDRVQSYRGSSSHKPIALEHLRLMTSAELETAAAEAGGDEDEDMESIREADRKDRAIQIGEMEQQLEVANRGVARTKKRLISYAIETIRDLQAEIVRAESDLATRKKAGRRRQRKATVTDDDSASSFSFDSGAGIDDSRGAVAPEPSGGGSASDIF